MPNPIDLTAPPIRDGDTPKMRAAIDTLQAHGANVTRCSPYHLKIGHINFYPDTGKINLDGHKAYKDRGLDVLLSILKYSQT
jgi:hypothetical protein